MILAARRPATDPLLTTNQRLQFAQEHVNWSLEDWKNVLFVDESRFDIHSPDRRQRVWRRPGERYAECIISTRVMFGGGSIMVCGGINFEARTELVVRSRTSLNAVRYVTDILEDHVVPFAQFIGENFLLLHDNTRPHTARVVNEYL